MWAKSNYREWHLGHIHNKKDMEVLSDENSGILLRRLRSLAAADTWTFNKGFKSLRAAEAFVWHPKKLLISQFTSTP